MSDLSAIVRIMCEQTPEQSIELVLDERAAGQARHFLRASSCPVHAASVVDDAELLVSELVTNGVRYGAPPITVQVSCDGGTALQVRVSDHENGSPRLSVAQEIDESGRGISLVDYISSDWGVELTAEGKTIWFILAL